MHDSKIKNLINILCEPDVADKNNIAIILLYGLCNNATFPAM